MREWGRRSLRLSGDWVSRLRNAPPPLPNDDNAPPPPTDTAGARAKAAPPQPLPPSAAVPNTSITTTPTSRHRRPPLFLTPTHHRAPALRSAGIISRTRIARSGAASPSPVPLPARTASPVRRANSHGGGGAPSIGPVPRSARRWARSAHLHEVRRAHAPPPDVDVFNVNGGRTTTGKGRSAPVTAVAGVFNSGKEREGARLRVPPSDSAAWMRDVGAAETWVDTDTDADAEEGEGGLWEIERD